MTRLLQFDGVNLATDVFTEYNGTPLQNLSVIGLIQAYPLVFGILPNYDGIPTLIADCDLGAGINLKVSGVSASSYEIPAINIYGTDGPALIRLFGGWHKPNK